MRAHAAAARGLVLNPHPQTRTLGGKGGHEGPHGVRPKGSRGEEGGEEGGTGSESGTMEVWRWIDECRKLQPTIAKQMEDLVEYAASTDAAVQMIHWN